MKIAFKKLNNSAIVPSYATPGSAGFDLVLNNFKGYYDNRVNEKAPNEINVVTIDAGVNAVTLNPNSRILVGCGFSVAIPQGYEMQVRSRSGLALKQGLIVLNAPGTIDSDYRGEIGAIICNNSLYAVTICIGDRIAQGVIAKHEVAEFEVSEELPESERGAGGFGSTGTK